MKNNQGFSNILVISLVLFLLGVGGYFGYSYYKNPVEQSQNKIEKNESQENTSKVSIYLDKKNTKVNNCGNVMQKLIKTMGNQKTVIAEISGKLFLYNNNLYFTSTNQETKLFSVFMLDKKTLNPTKLKDFKFDGVNDTSSLLINDNLYFTLNHKTLFKLNLNNYNVTSIDLAKPMDIHQFSENYILLAETPMQKCPREVYEYYPDNADLYDLNLKKIKSINNIIKQENNPPEFQELNLKYLTESNYVKNIIILVNNESYIIDKDSKY